MKKRWTIGNYEETMNMIVNSWNCPMKQLVLKHSQHLRINEEEKGLDLPRRWLSNKMAYRALIVILISWWCFAKCIDQLPIHIH